MKVGKTRRGLNGHKKSGCSCASCHTSETGEGSKRGIVLRRMKKGQAGTITAVRARGEIGKRIREIGLIPGTRIAVEKRAPLYDPVALRVMGCIITLRNSEADNIEVRLD